MPSIDPFDAYVEIAVIDDADRFRLASRTEELLSANGIRAVIEGSVTYSVLVPQDDAAQAKVVLKSSRLVSHFGVQLVRD